MRSPLCVLLLSALALGGCDDDESTANAPDASLTPDAGAGGDGGPVDQGIDPCTFESDGVDQYAAPPLHTPRWAFLPWISKDISDRADSEAFLAGFQARDIPVGVMVIDSPWETHYNTYLPNPTRYPDFEGMVRDFRDQGVRTVLWTTQMVNTSGLDFEAGGDLYVGPSPNYEEGALCDFYVNEGDTYLWWKGRGSGIDFFNPVATTWLHRQYDHLLDLGVAGWKLDFGEQYIKTDPIQTAAGDVPFQAYSEKYYEDFYAYGATRQGTAEFVTMVRPYDQSYEHEGRFFARPEHAPVAWVGDNRRDWVGLIDALDHLFRSAQAGYVVIGSDVGGYLDFEDVGLTPGPPVAASQETFVRWVAMGAMNPFFQLHGRANLAPWTVEPNTEKTVAVYRYWAWLHTALVPFWYSLAEAAYAGGPNIMRPIGEGPEQWADDWRFLVGDAFLVAPIIADGGTRDVALPAGARWYDWWRPELPAFEGGTTVEAYDAADQLIMPLFVREGAIVPLDVVNDANGLGTAASAGHLTVLVYPGPEPSQFTLVDTDEAPTTLGHDAGTITLSRALQPVILRVRADPGTAVEGAGEQHFDQAAFFAADSGWYANSVAQQVWIRLPASDAPQSVSLGLE